MCSMGRMEWLVLCRQLMLCLSNKYVRPFPGGKNGQDFPSSPVTKSPPASAGNTGSIPAPGRFHMLWSS